jgi:glycosyltransferase involved in cell wall biosynthesis
MTTQPTVSVVLIFLNEEKFLGEAIESVLAQSYRDWELLLVDDGSSDRSTEIAQSFAARHPDRIRFLEHPGHANRGVSASRNLGCAQARGRLIAPLDGDDVWLPEKLEQQVALLDANPEAGMLYGQSRYWYSWSGNSEDRQRDFLPTFGVPSHTTVQPPGLLTMFLTGEAAVPCPSDILVRRDRLLAVGGFEESFKGIYQVQEDQAFYAKFCLVTPVLAIEKCWFLYRQHPQANTATTLREGRDLETRRYFLDWLQSYLRAQGVSDVLLWRAVARESWLLDFPGWLPRSMWRHWRWARKWLLRSGMARPESAPPVRQ